MLSVRRSDLDWAADGVQLGLGWWCTTARLGLCSDSDGARQRRNWFPLNRESFLPSSSN